ncbi:hypothetical protein BDI4_100048 [Burkholderia diffusa]|uniref:hypothetical protein n=1 Tax=Burkholderia diffusa TaxID=488732 RepID=UPI001CAEE41B|nr:hypothetical protein [Burkholderia diffusa]CAG9241106.1 hypothetical protein BDI4_100048 [Burkholderia diffusa]
MPRARNIKPGVMVNEDLARLRPLHRLLWIFLWMLADREGRLEDRPVRIKAKALPYDDADVNAALDELHQTGFIVRYSVGAQGYIQVINFSKHQKPHSNEAPSEIPPVPDEVMAKLATKVASAADLGDKGLLPRRHALGPCISDSLIDGFSDYLIAGEEKLSPALRVEARQKIEARGSRLPEGWKLPAEWAQWASATCGFTSPQVHEIADGFADYWHAEAGAKARKRDWFATWRNWCRRERAARQRSSRTGRAHDGVPLTSLDSTALDALARELGVSPARPGESMQAFIGRIQAAQNRRDLH